jgi:hypothetical protein
LWAIRRDNSGVRAVPSLKVNSRFALIRDLSEASALGRLRRVGYCRARFARALFQSVSQKKLRISSENRDGACFAERFFFYSSAR